MTSTVVYKTASGDVPRRHSVRIWLLAALSALLPLPPARLAAQAAPGDTVRVGSPALNGSFLRPYANLWRVTVTLPNGTVRDFGTSSDSVQRVRVGATPAFRRTQVATGPGDLADTTVNVFDAATLAPLADSMMRKGAHFRHRQFAGTRVRAGGPADSAGRSAETELTLESSMFDFYGGMWGLLLAGLPLRAGYAATLPSIYEFSDSVGWVSPRVVGRERLTVPHAGRVDAWVSCRARQCRGR
jgi:hypothetical protein